eukprot:4390598-Amphidinium_carterae.1
MTLLTWQCHRIMLSVPDEYLRSCCQFALPPEGQYGAALTCVRISSVVLTLETDALLMCILSMDMQELEIFSFHSRRISARTTRSKRLAGPISQGQSEHG